MLGIFGIKDKTCVLAFEEPVKSTIIQKPVNSFFLDLKNVFLGASQKEIRREARFNVFILRSFTIGMLGKTVTRELPPTTRQKALALVINKYTVLFLLAYGLREVIEKVNARQIVVTDGLRAPAGKCIHFDYFKHWIDDKGELYYKDMPQKCIDKIVEVSKFSIEYLNHNYCYKKVIHSGGYFWFSDIFGSVI